MRYTGGMHSIHNDLTFFQGEFHSSYLSTVRIRSAAIKCVTSIMNQENN